MRILSPIKKGVLGCLITMALYVLKKNDEDHGYPSNVGKRAAHRSHKCLYINERNVKELETGNWMVIMDIRKNPMYFYMAEKVSRFSNVAILYVSTLQTAELAAKLEFSIPGQIIYLRHEAGGSNNVFDKKIPLSDIVDVYLLGKLLRIKEHIHKRLLSNAHIYLNLIHMVSFVVGKVFM